MGAAVTVTPRVRTRLGARSVRIHHWLTAVVLAAILFSVVARPAYVAMLRRAPAIVTSSFREFFIDGPAREKTIRHNQEIYDRRRESWHATKNAK